jgi:protein-tyrosine phosphatase
MKILMVCLGNICRSPLAHGILEHKVQQQHLDWEVDSCGTGGWHAGEKPDMRSRAIAQDNGIDINAQRARKITADDIANYRFDFCDGCFELPRHPALLPHR